MVVPSFLLVEDVEARKADDAVTVYVSEELGVRSFSMMMLTA